MDKPNDYRGLNFNQPQKRVSSRVITVVVSFVGFCVTWWVVPHNILFWLLLPLFVVISWMASYGWHQALAVLIRFLQNLGRFY